MVVDTEKNTWRDTEDLLLYGGIYDLVYEMTGSCSRSELNLFIATKMSAIQKVEQPKSVQQKLNPGRKMRF